MFKNVLSLVSHATIGIAASKTARPPITSGIGDNAAGISDNSAEIGAFGGDAAGIVDIAAKVIPC